jgi:hypothetical protein
MNWFGDWTGTKNELVRRMAGTENGLVQRIDWYRD